jgi:hypothetical protein
MPAPKIGTPAAIIGYCHLNMYQILFRNHNAPGPSKSEQCSYTWMVLVGIEPASPHLLLQVKCVHYFTPQRAQLTLRVQQHNEGDGIGVANKTSGRINKRLLTMHP